MSRKHLMPALCIATSLAFAGCAAVGDQAAPVAPAYPPSIQRIVANEGYALDATGRPAVSADAAKPAREMFEWEKNLRDNPAAASMVFESVHGVAPGVDYSDFYRNAYYQ